MATKPLTLTGKSLRPEDVAAVALPGARVALSTEALRRVARSKAVLDSRAKQEPVYGVSTGFGPMANRLIGTKDLAALQQNLVRSHACGVGEPTEARIVRAAMVVRLNTLLAGYSGVSQQLLAALRDLYNAGVVPLVPERGGVGASGDLVQLAHIALTLMGEGEAFYKGKRMPAARALKAAKLLPYALEAKEGLALINGTAYMSAVAVFALADAKQLLSAGLRSGALALEAAHGFADALHPKLHAARGQKGQARVARALRALLRGSQLVRERAAFTRTHALSEKTVELAEAAQDVYSLRCIPQIMGPMLETYEHAYEVVAQEVNAATDNPLVEVQSKTFLHGGNFHGEYVAVAMDQLKAALIKLCMLAERRSNFFLHSAINKRFPPFLNMGMPGLTLGLQGLQFSATSTTARAQSCGYPHSLHSIPSNGDNQDVVSMGADAAHQALEVAGYAATVLAIESIVLSQAMGTSREERLLGSASAMLVRKVRALCPLVRHDRPLMSEVAKTAAWIAADAALELDFRG